jgi:hypothetical protein
MAHSDWSMVHAIRDIMSLEWNPDIIYIQVKFRMNNVGSFQATRTIRVLGTKTNKVKYFHEMTPKFN